jgi:hypothetical protein
MVVPDTTLLEDLVFIYSRIHTDAPRDVVATLRSNIHALSAPTFNIPPVFTPRPPFRPWHASSRNTSASSRRLLGTNGDTWSDIPMTAPTPYVEEWLKKYTTGKGGTFKKFARPKFQATQHSHGFGKPYVVDEPLVPSLPAQTFEDHERRVAEECEGIDPNILDGVYDQPAYAEPSYEMDFTVEHIPASLPFAEEQTPQPQAQRRLEQWVWGIAPFNITRPTSSEMKEWEAKLRAKMGDDYHPPEIARSRVLNFNRETTRLTPSPRTPDDNKLVAIIDVNTPVSEKVLWERALRDTDYIDGVYLLVMLKHQLPRAYFITDAYEDMRDGRYFTIPDDQYRAGMQVLAAKLRRDVRILRGTLRLLVFSPPESVTVSEVEICKPKPVKDLITLFESVVKTACVV